MLEKATTPESIPPTENENNYLSKVLIALIFFLLSFFCIFCSSQSALWFIDRDQIEASTVSSRQANYKVGPLMVVPRVNAAAIAAEAEADRRALAGEALEPILGGLVPVSLPPLPTPTAIATVVAALPTRFPTIAPPASPAPTPVPDTPQPSPVPSPAPPAPTPAATPASPTEVPPTPVSPTSPPPTQPPATQPPTAIPSSVPPTVPPATATSIVPTEAPPEPPIIFFTATAYNINEGDGFATITVALSKPWPQVVQVNYASSNGTATVGSDYASVSGTLNFNPNQVIQTFTVPIIQDGLHETDETVLFTLSNPINANLGAVNSTVLIIVNDDPIPTVEFDRLDYTRLETGGTARITVTLSMPSGIGVTVNYTTNNISALAGSDYTSTSGTLTFSPGQTVANFTVPIIDDSLNEANETLSLTLSGPVNATLGPTNPATLTIIENDRPTIAFSNPNYGVSEGVGTALITATLDAPSALTVTVNYTSSDLSATAGADYLTATGTLTFIPGQTQTMLPVTVLEDSISNEFTETLVLGLNTPLNAILGVPSSPTLSILDNDGPPRVGFVNTQYSVNEGNDGGNGQIFSTVFVTLSNPSALTVTVSYNTSDGTATVLDGDYNATSGSLTFSPGQTGASFEVVINNDAATEAFTESVSLTLDNPVNASLSAANATLLVFDDDNAGPPPCTGVVPAGEPEVGLPNNVVARLSCGSYLDVPLGGQPISTDGTTNYDMVFYEFRQTSATPPTEFIFLDWMVVQISQNPGGPWYTVFYWGDSSVDLNTNIGQAGFGPDSMPPLDLENDNEVIDLSFLYGTLPLKTGVLIDIDARAPAGVYNYVRFYSPIGGANDVLEIDAVAPLP